MSWFENQAQARPRWPVPVQTAPLRDVIAVRRDTPDAAQPERDETGTRCVYLDAAGRQQLWSGIQRHNPALADLLQSEEIQSIREHFGGFTLLLTPEDLRRYMSEPE